MAPPQHPLKNEAQDALRAGATAAEVAERYSLSLRTVEKWRAALGLAKQGERGADRTPRGGHDQPRGQAQAIVSMLLADLAPLDIAKALGVSTQAVYKARRRWL